MYDMLITAISTLELSEWAGQAIHLNLRIPQHFTVPKAEQNHSFEFSVSSTSYNHAKQIEFISF